MEGPSFGEGKVSAVRHHRMKLGEIRKATQKQIQSRIRTVISEARVSRK